tara:strand:+ start:3602 stop:4024 length:423 start_codon:yes stop_codon:yes gene_type:complete
MAYVSESIEPIASRTSFYTTLNLKNMSALDSLGKGTATKLEADVVIEALNICEAYCMMNVGREYRQDVLNALSALQDVCVRSLTSEGKFICQDNEFELIKLGFEVHTAQLEVATIGSLETAIKLVFSTLKAKRAKVIQDA